MKRASSIPDMRLAPEREKKWQQGLSLWNDVFTLMLVGYIRTIYWSFEQLVVNRDQLGTPVNQFPDLLSFIKIIVNEQEIICLLLISMANAAHYRFENLFLPTFYIESFILKTSCLGKMPHQTHSFAAFCALVCW